MEKRPNYHDLVAPWKNDQKTRDDLITKIRTDTLKNVGATGSYNNFTEEKIAEEYYKAWLDLPASASLQKIGQHPLLDKKMKERIDQELWDQKQSMLKWSAGLTCLCVGLYLGLFSRMPRFVRFFNHPDSYMVTRGVKKTLAVYGVFLGWVASLTSSYEKGMP